MNKCRNLETDALAYLTYTGVALVYVYAALHFGVNSRQLYFDRIVYERLL